MQWCLNNAPKNWQHSQNQKNKNKNKNKIEKLYTSVTWTEIGIG